MPTSTKRRKAPLKKLTAAMIQAAELYLRGWSMRAVAKHMGVAEPTLYGWRREPVFKNHCTARIQELQAETAEILSGRQAQAMSYLSAAMDLEHPDHGEVTPVGVRAAAKILDLAATAQLAKATTDIMSRDEMIKAIQSLPPWAIDVIRTMPAPTRGPGRPHLEEDGEDEDGE